MVNQYWTMVKIDGQEVSIEVKPGLVLNVSELQQAANLAKRENTTVRLPIKLPDEAPNFGVWALPNLPNHVAVGPFTSKN